MASQPWYGTVATVSFMVIHLFNTYSAICEQKKFEIAI